MSDIDIVEVLWCLLIGTGLVFGISNLIATYRDLKVDGDTEFSDTLLTGLLWQVGVRCIAQVFLLTAGILALLDPGHTCAPVEHKHLFDLIEASMFVVGLSVTANSFIGWVMRRRLNRLA